MFGWLRGLFLVTRYSLLACLVFFGLFYFSSLRGGGGFVFVFVLGLFRDLVAGHCSCAGAVRVVTGQLLGGYRVIY